MTRMVVLSATVGLLMASIPCRAQSDPNLARENAQLRQRVENLEEQMKQLQAAVEPAPRPDSAADEAAEPAAAPRTVPAKPEDNRKPFWSTLDIQFYGYIKADASWDSSRVTTGNYVIFVDPGGEGDDEFNLTARQTRLGLKIKGPDVGDLQTRGLLEGDFYGAGGEENKNIFRMRHAYMELLWPQDHIRILAGQTWDVISPLYPDTLNFTILWDGGNIGHRHPQIRVTREMALESDMELELAGAISRTIGDLEEAAGSTRPGEDAGFPTFQGRIGLTFPWFGSEPTAIGLSGHWGEEEYAGDNDVKSWSINLDVLQPASETLVIKGEAFVGANLDNYFGGIGQGVRHPDTTADEAIGSKGGWVAAGWKPCKDWRFNVGIGIDDVDRDDLGATGRTLNRAVFGNALYAINAHADVGLELSHWRTDYKNDDDADDVRIQTSFVYKF